MLIIAICDDIAQERKNLTTLVQDFCSSFSYEIQIMSFSSGEDLVSYHENESTPFDIIFLDIYMGGNNGIVTAQKIREFNLQCKIIFSTTSTEHALDSFIVFPFYYLTKPVNREVFQKVFKMAIETIATEKQKCFTVKTETQIHSVLYKDIHFFESTLRKINLHTKQGIIAFYAKLDDIEANIKDPRFFRCHKSFLINMDYIATVGDFSFILVDNTQVSITQRAFANIKKEYYRYIYNKANLKNNL